MQRELSVCSLFYVFIEKENAFIVASAKETQHIRHVLENESVAGSISVETTKIASIQGLQFSGIMYPLKEKILSQNYFKKFPYAKELEPLFWKIKMTTCKMTDNTQGFGTKIIWP